MLVNTIQFVWFIGKVEWITDLFCFIYFITFLLGLSSCIEESTVLTYLVLAVKPFITITHFTLQLQI